MSSSSIPKIVPAQLSFLALYNPALGRSDDEFHNQLVFYYSRAAKARARTHGKNPIPDPQAEAELREHENEKLRQVGLAQGLAGFARSFSDGAAVDSVDTKKSRIVLHELEEGWWVLASIDLTQLPSHHASASHGTGNKSEPTVEYSSREVSPPGLLIQQLIRAHNVFLLHHGTTLDGLLHKYDRIKFCTIIERYWSRFASNWDVLLHGSPAVDTYNGIKLAAGGELGMGVGEEEWGSGERLVLEDFVQKTDGLVDMIVSRFGDPSPLQDQKTSSKSIDPNDVSGMEPWLGGGASPRASDGVVFSGVGALSRHSLRDMSHWMESIYAYGDRAYGVRDNPTADRKRRRRKNVEAPQAEESPAPSTSRTERLESDPNPPKTESGLPPGIPPPLVKAVETSLNNASKAVDSLPGPIEDSSAPLFASLGDTETWVKYLTLGYGSSWGGRRGPDERTGAQESEESPAESPMRLVDPKPDIDYAAEKLKAQVEQENAGYFVVGLKGDLGEGDGDDSSDEGDWNNRTLLRTIHVEMAGGDLVQTPGTGEDETPTYEKELTLRPISIPNLTRLRPVIYVQRPFVYAFLFRHRTGSLTLSSFYRHLHSYFSPLHRPLCNSTSPSKVASRISSASNPYTTTSSSKSSAANIQPIYDLVYDPRTLTVHSSIPNIPDPGTLSAEGLAGSNAYPADWNRLEALNVHSQILAMVSSTRRNLTEIEQTCKTNRGWWVVWMRLAPSQGGTGNEMEGGETVEFDTSQLREAFLVRRARDALAPTAKSSGSRFTSGLWKPTGETMGGAAAGWGPRGLAEGIGIDARRYVEGLLSLSR